MHDTYLLAALIEAIKGRGLCAPNPSVGAVAVKNNEIIARAWHRGAGTPHAEKLLIEQLPSGLSDVTLYVTLEPCNHQGRTPPCVNAIIEYGFKTVVYAFRDPNPIVAKNNSSALLEAQGIQVIHHPLSEIDAFYEAYNYWVKTGKPWVTAKLAQSFDGKIGTVHSEKMMISNEACKVFTHQNRGLSDIILTTSATVNADDPLLNVRIENQTQSKPVAILDRTLSTKPNAQLFSTASHCHFFYDETLVSPQATDQCTYYPTPTVKSLADRKELDLVYILQKIGNLGFHSVWVEAGGILFSALHREHLVQRTHIYLVPNALGEEAISAYHHAEIFRHPKRVSWTPMDDNMIATLDWESDLMKQFAKDLI